jgi:5-methylthioribose kinase
VSRDNQLRGAYPGAVFLTATDIHALAAYLAGKGWLQTGELLRGVTRAGEGNMNCVLRIVTSQRSFILKQSRPWVEKYPNIPAPWDRALVEARFYREVEGNESVAKYMPQLLAFDPAERILMLEDLGDAQDLTFLYSLAATNADSADLKMLTNFLIALHTAFRDSSLAAKVANEEMRALNHEHIFSLPLRKDNGLDLETITPGLSLLARHLQQDDTYCQEVSLLGKRYLCASQGTCLIHGDYFPGSWLKARRRVYVIDPEFCFYGPPEWDLGVMIAHLHLAGQSHASIANVSKHYAESAAMNAGLMSQFAGVEIMRRLIGVAQLPVRFCLERKNQLLELSKNLVLRKGAL